METFRSRVSVGIAVAIYAVSIVTFAVNLALSFNWIMTAVFVVLLAFVSDIMFNTRYVIHGHNLYIRSGMFFESNLDIRSVYRIARTRSIESAPAASLHRLKLCYGKRKYVIVSPRCEDMFVKTLTEINPDIAVEM